MAYKVEFGSKDDRKVKPNLATNQVIRTYDQLVERGELDVLIYGPDRQIVDPHTLRLAIKGTKFG